jgi:anionic cell wall polymer biosynthesis LytR-Cps2A-Psr (LCP) family protein
MKKSNTDASVLLLVAIVFLFAAGVAAALYTLRSDPVEEALSGDRVISVLYVIEKAQKPLSTFVLMYYPATKRTAVFDIPGELGLLIRRINRVDRIDTVYNPQRVSGYETEIESLLGIDITFAIIIPVENLGKAVDLLEGVEIFIPSPVTERSREGRVLFPSGLRRLDGDKAVDYISYESPDEEPDAAMFRRQRFFLGFLKRQGEMNEQLKNPAVSPLYQSFLNTGMSRRTRIRLFDEFTGIDTGRTTIQSVGGNLREVSSQMLLIPYYDGNLVKEIVRQTLGSLTRPNEGTQSDRVFTVEVLNGTAVSGLAGRTAELLRGFGYDIIAIGNAVAAGNAVTTGTGTDSNDYEKTVIIDHSGQEKMVQIFADVIRCGNIRYEAPEDRAEEDAAQNYEYRSDFTLIIGRDFNGRYVTGN